MLPEKTVSNFLTYLTCPPPPCLPILTFVNLSQNRFTVPKENNTENKQRLFQKFFSFFIIISFQILKSINSSRFALPKQFGKKWQTNISQLN
jgi:hypothetical protein